MMINISYTLSLYVQQQALKELLHLKKENQVILWIIIYKTSVCCTAAVKNWNQPLGSAINQLKLQ